MISFNGKLPQGFSLEEEDDHFVYLVHKGRRIAAFSAQATVSEIEQVARDWARELEQGS